MTQDIRKMDALVKEGKYPLPALAEMLVEAWNHQRLAGKTLVEHFGLEASAVAMLDVACKPDACLRSLEFLQYCEEFATPSQLAGIAANVESASLTLDTWALLDRHCDAVFAPLEELVLRRKPRPQQMASSVWLVAQFGRNGSTPPVPLVDEMRQRVGHFPESHQARVMEATTAIEPTSEREKFVLAQTDRFFWNFFKACPTAKVVEEAISRVEAQGRGGDCHTREKLFFFSQMTPEFTDLLIKSLATPVPQRSILVRGLAATKDPNSLDTLVKLLGDSLEDVRTEAIKGLKAQKDASLPLLAKAIGARKKQVRLSALEAVKMFGIGDEAIEAAITKQLTKEKVDAVRDLLFECSADQELPAAVQNSQADDGYEYTYRQDRSVTRTAGPPASAGPEVVHPELESDIIAQPNVADAYLVYADWLQTQEDPRGQLIVLLHDLSRKPQDRALRLEITSIFGRHTERLLGPLDTMLSKLALTLEWQYGFVKKAQVLGDNTPDMEEALRTVLEHPSCRFLQELEVSGKRLAPVDFKSIRSFLLSDAVELKTLCSLAVGKPGLFQVDDALIAKFPRLQRDTTTLWDKAQAAIAKQRLKVKYEHGSLPPLKLLDKHLELDVDMSQLLVGLKAELGKGRDLGLITAMRKLFTPGSLDLFAAAVASQWQNALSASSASRWGFELLRVFGGDASVTFIGHQMESWSPKRIEQALKMLESIGTDFAIFEIFCLMANSPPRLMRHEHAQRSLERLAPLKSLDYDELITTSVPAELTVEECQDRHRRAILWQLENMMRAGYRMSYDCFQRDIVGKRIVRSFAEQLIWGRFESKSVPDGLSFAIDPACIGIDVRGEQVELGDSDFVSLLHPLEFGDTLLGWQNKIAASDQPFEQLHRPVFALSEQQKTQKFLAGFEPEGAYRLDGTLGWDIDEIADQGGTQAWSKFFARDQTALVIDLGQFPRIRVYDQSKEPIAELHPVSQSELLYDLHRAMGDLRPGQESVGDSPGPTTVDSAEPIDVGLPQTGKYPFAEAAKSSRSKCVICEEKIEKATIRIGIARKIATDHFSGVGTAWLHADCRSKCPELSGMKDIEERLSANSSGAWPAQA